MGSGSLPVFLCLQGALQPRTAVGGGGGRGGGGGGGALVSYHSLRQYKEGFQQATSMETVVTFPDGVSFPLPCLQV